MQNLSNTLVEIANGLTGGLLPYVLPCALVVLVLWFLWRIIRQRPRDASRHDAPPTIDLATLGREGPPEGPPILEFYHLPVRLAAVILAPAGRIRELPPDDQLPQWIDAIVPGLAKVLASHRPIMHCWPNQVSASGFAHRVFNSVKLPGDGGKGSPWATVAGIAKVHNQPIMAGLVLRAANANHFGQTIIEAEHQWLGCLRVKLS